MIRVKVGILVNMQTIVSCSCTTEYDVILNSTPLNPKTTYLVFPVIHYQSIDRSIDPSINQPTNQPTNQSINQCLFINTTQINNIIKVHNI